MRKIKRISSPVKDFILRVGRSKSFRIKSIKICQGSKNRFLWHTKSNKRIQSSHKIQIRTQILDEIQNFEWTSNDWNSLWMCRLTVFLILYARTQKVEWCGFRMWYIVIIWRCSCEFASCRRSDSDRDISETSPSIWKYHKQYSLLVSSISHYHNNLPHFSLLVVNTKEEESI